MQDEVWIKFYKNWEYHESITFSKANIYIKNKTEYLQQNWIKAWDKIIVQLPNSIDTIITYLALYYIEAIAVPVLEDISKIRLDFIITNCKAKAHITTEGIEIIDHKENNIKESNNSNISTIIYTSGTTWTPKWVCLWWKNWIANANSLIEHHKLGPSIVFASPLLLSHCNAHGFTMIATYLAKSKLILFDKYCDNLLDIINIEKVNILSVVPAILHKLFENNEHWTAHKDMMYIVTAAAPLNSKLFNKVYKSRGLQIVQWYWLSESTNFSCTMPTNLNGDEYSNIMKPYPSIWISLPWVTIRVWDNDTEWQIWELYIKSDSNFYWYYSQLWQIDTQRINTWDLWYFKIFHNQKFYYLVGRSKELINRWGEKISPIEIEEELFNLGLTWQFAIIKTDSEIYWEDIALVCTETPNIDIIKLLPSYRRPKSVFIVDQFLYTATWKFQRNQMYDSCKGGKFKEFIIIN